MVDNQPEGSDDRRKILEVALAELGRRDDREDDRERTANSKLTSALVALPIIITLSTAAFFNVLQYAVRVGAAGYVGVCLFVAAILAFVVAAIVAIRGLWPMLSKYSAIGLNTITRFSENQTYEAYLNKLLTERKDAVRANGAVNARKLGLYATSSALSVVGLVLLTVTVMLFFITALVAPDKVLSTNLAPNVSPVPTVVPRSHTRRMPSSPLPGARAGRPHATKQP